MKTTTLALTLLATMLTISQTASAQEFRFGPISVDLNGWDYDHDLFDHDRRPYVPQPRRPIRPRPEVNPNPYENPIYVQPKQLERLEYDFHTGRWKVKTKSEVIHESALDPYRSHVDPGSFRVTSNVGRDRHGNIVETRVERWTSYGRPHSKTTRRVIRRNGKATIEDEHEVLRSPGAPNFED